MCPCSSSVSVPFIHIPCTLQIWVFSSDTPDILDQIILYCEWLIVLCVVGCWAASLARTPCPTCDNQNVSRLFQVSPGSEVWAQIGYPQLRTTGWFNLSKWLPLLIGGCRWLREHWGCQSQAGVEPWELRGRMIPKKWCLRPANKKIYSISSHLHFWFRYNIGNIFRLLFWPSLYLIKTKMCSSKPFI